MSMGKAQSKMSYTLGKAEVGQTPFLELVELSKGFGDEDIAVSDLSLTLREGELFSILGPSGCGKTTTLRMVAGLESPTQGRILLDGADITEMPPNRRPVNTVFQGYALFSHLTIAENVAFGLREKGISRSERERLVTEALTMVQLKGYEMRRTSQISGGQEQRVALARAIVNRPRVLLLDEPLGALDLKLRKAMQIELKNLQQRLGMTFIYVTHDQEEALTLSDRIAVMQEGRIRQVGTPEEIYDYPLSRYVADFIGAANCVPGAVGARDEEGYAFHIPKQQTVRALGPASLAEGTRGRLVIRPERCRLADPRGGVGLVGHIVEVLFRGLHRSYLIELPTGDWITAYVPHLPSDKKVAAIGDEVLVTWSGEDAWLVKEP